MLLRVARVSGWSGPRDLLPVGQQFLEQLQRFVRVPAFPGQVRDVVADGQGIGVVQGAEDLLQVGQQFLQQTLQRLLRVSAFLGEGRDVVAGGQGVGVVRAQDPRRVGQELLG